MKTKLNPSRNAGSAMLVTLFILTILAVSIAGYLKYTNQQSFLGSRAQTWNMALAVSEAGVEEGLQQLNVNSANLSADGWTADGSTYSITRNFSNGNSYSVSIDFTNTVSPVIVSRAFVVPPRMAQNNPTVMFAATGVNTTTDSTNVTRAVRVRCTRGNLILGAMVAKHKIDMNGNNILTDSFDSGDSSKSTSGRYDVTKAGDRGDVASNDGVINTVAAGNANLYGHVYTGPGGSVSVGSNGGIGEHSWQATHTGIESGWMYNNANFTFPNTDLPYNSGLTPGPADIIEVSGYTTGTNATVYNAVPNPPGALSPGQTVSPITTNTSSTVASTYPGNKPGLTTNTTWVTSGTYPGSTSGLTTNYIGFTTVTSHPGLQPQLSTNCASTATKVKTFPPSGSYCGTPFQTGNDVNWWYFYAVLSYTYANQYSYTYPKYTYTYTTYTYNYTIYDSAPLYVTNHYDHVLASGDYYTSDLGGKTLVTGTARLVMPDGLKMSGNDQVTIQPGAGLTLWSGGDSMTIGGNGILNQGGNAASLIAYGAPTVKDLTFNGNGEFTGVLIAPNADTRMNGGGTGVDDFTGAIMVNSVKMNGHFRFHYDEALSRLPSNGRFLITSWDEIP